MACVACLPVTCWHGNIGATQDRQILVRRGGVGKCSLDNDMSLADGQADVNDTACAVAGVHVLMCQVEMDTGMLLGMSLP